MIVDASLQLKTSIPLDEGLNFQKEEVDAVNNALKNDFPELFYSYVL